MSPSSPSLVDRLRSARERRGALLSDARTTALRLVNGVPDGVPDVTVDTFAGVYVVSASTGTSSPPRSRPCSTRPWRPGRRAASTSSAARARPGCWPTPRGTCSPPSSPPEASPLESLEALENGLRFLIRPAQGLSVGLYLDMRETRAWLLGQVKGLTVLNLFSYTCAFGVVAHRRGRLAGAQHRHQPPRAGLGRGERAPQRPARGPLRLCRGRRVRLARAPGEEGAGVRCGDAATPPRSPPRGRPGSPPPGTTPRWPRPPRAWWLPEGGWWPVATCRTLTRRRFEAMVSEGVGRAGRQGRSALSLGPSPVDFPWSPEAPPGLKVNVIQLR